MKRKGHGFMEIRKIEKVEETPGSQRQPPPPPKLPFQAWGGPARPTHPPPWGVTNLQKKPAPAFASGHNQRFVRAHKETRPGRRVPPTRPPRPTSTPPPSVRSLGEGHRAFGQPWGQEGGRGVRCVSVPPVTRTIGRGSDRGPTAQGPGVMIRRRGDHGNSGTEGADGGNIWLAVDLRPAAATVIAENSSFLNII